MMRRLLLRAGVLVGLLALAGCLGLPARQFGDSPHTLGPPFLAAWEATSGQPGPPRSAPIWLNGQRVQLFDRALMVAATPDERAPVRVIWQRRGWVARFPVGLLTANAAPQRAVVGLVRGDGHPAGWRPGLSRGALDVSPLRPRMLTLQVAGGYSGPAEIHLYDGRLQPAGVLPVQVVEGRARARVLPRGWPGPQWALVLVDGQLAGASDGLLMLEPTTELATGEPDLDALYPMARYFLQQQMVSYPLDGRMVRGYRSPDNPLLWLRDHVYQGRGFRYFARDMRSLLDAFRRAQRPDGSLPDVLDYPALGVHAHRLETESDLEFLFVQGVYEAWQATGDDAWLRAQIPALRRAVAYSMSDPARWDATHRLLRRPYTIDMWDFAYGPTTTDPETGKPAPRHWIDAQTTWGVFHGDNTGLAYALGLLARIERQTGNEEAARQREQQRRGLLDRLQALSWNGRFFTHFVPLEGALVEGTVPPPAVDTAAQLSLSNAYALNREVLSFEQGRRIVESYFARRDFARAFAEWYSIDPPFPPGSYGLAGRPGEQPGEYVNGGILPLVGGELARGAFGHGAEAYGFDILRRYAALLRLTGASYLWYYPTGQPGISGPDTVATDGWGASAMLGALLEGAAGVVDRDSRYRRLELSPRWAAAPELTDVRVVARYGASQGYVAYRWQRTAQGFTLDLTGTWQQARIRLLLPEDAGEVRTVRTSNPVRPAREPTERPPQVERVGGSRYLILDARGGSLGVEVAWE